VIVNQVPALVIPCIWVAGVTIAKGAVLRRGVAPPGALVAAHRVHAAGRKNQKDPKKQKKEVGQASPAFCKTDIYKCPKPRNELLDEHRFLEKSEFA
jgi:hypothetical protein